MKPSQSTINRIKEANILPLHIENIVKDFQKFKPEADLSESTVDALFYVYVCGIRDALNLLSNFNQGYVPAQTL